MQTFPQLYIIKPIVCANLRSILNITNPLVMLSAYVFMSVFFFNFMMNFNMVDLADKSVCVYKCVCKAWHIQLIHAEPIRITSLCRSHHFSLAVITAISLFVRRLHIALISVGVKYHVYVYFKCVFPLHKLAPIDWNSVYGHIWNNNSKCNDHDKNNVENK